MPWNLLIFPLVAGYFVLTRSNLFKYVEKRLDSQRLIFESILTGTLICAITFFFRLLFQKLFLDTFVSISDSFPFKLQYTLTSLSTLLIAIAFVYIGNWLFFDKLIMAKKAIKDVGNEFELLMKSSFVNSKMLLFSISNDKFYIGWVKELPIPSVSGYVRIIPAISGYRDDEKELVFTSEYLVVYAEYIKQGKIKNIDDLSIILPNIRTVS